VILLEATQQLDLAGRAKRCIYVTISDLVGDLLRQVKVIACVSLTHGDPLAAFHETLSGVLTDRLQQSIPALHVPLIGLHQRLVDQLGEQIEHVRLLDAVSSIDNFGCRERPAAGEHGQSPKQSLLSR
jgi:hypothetical protein